VTVFSVTICIFESLVLPKIEPQNSPDGVVLIAPPRVSCAEMSWNCQVWHGGKVRTVGWLLSFFTLVSARGISSIEQIKSDERIVFQTEMGNLELALWPEVGLWARFTCVDEGGGRKRVRDALLILHGQTAHVLCTIKKESSSMLYPWETCCKKTGTKQTKFQHMH
jgi:hypothetical protein